MPGRIDGIYDRFVDTLPIHGFFFLCKESGTRNEVLIGQRIKAWSAFDSCFYSGTVDDFNPEKTTLTRLHVIVGKLKYYAWTVRAGRR